MSADNYKDFRETIVNQNWRRQILPATFCGGPRYIFERQQDALAYVRKVGRPDLFRTMTTNPKCPEILESLTPGQQTHDCLDPLVRVFRPKIQKLLKDGCFDCLEAWLYSIEFQKRGLPHAHILLWLSHDAKNYLCYYVYRFISVYTVPKHKLYLYNFFIIIFSVQDPSEAGHLS